MFRRHPNHPAVRIVPEPEALAEAGAHLFARHAAEATLARGAFSCALAGGSTPRALYERLSVGKEDVRWNTVHAFYGDERFVPLDDPRSNARMAFEALLGHVPIPPATVHSVPTGEPTPVAAADAYERDVLAFFKGRGLLHEGMPRFDLVLLGMGADGHTASLFPGSPALQVRDRVACAVRAPGVEVPDRVTVTLPALRAARAVVFLVSGAPKAEALRAALSEPADPLLRPCQGVQPAEGDLLWLVDEAAAALL